MAVRQARSGTRGRPPFGFGGAGGTSGSTISHNSSGSSGLATIHLLPPLLGLVPVLKDALRCEIGGKISPFHNHAGRLCRGGVSCIAVSVGLHIPITLVIAQNVELLSRLLKNPRVAHFASNPCPKHAPKLSGHLSPLSGGLSTETRNTVDKERLREALPLRPSSPLCCTLSSGFQVSSLTSCTGEKPPAFSD